MRVISPNSIILLNDVSADQIVRYKDCDKVSVNDLVRIGPSYGGWWFIEPYVTPYSTGDWICIVTEINKFSRVLNDDSVNGNSIILDLTIERKGQGIYKPEQFFINSININKIN